MSVRHLDFSSLAKRQTSIMARQYSKRRCQRNTSYILHILPPFLKKVSKSIFYKLQNGHSFIGNTSSMINFEEGLNKYGLAAAMTFLVPTMIVPGVNSLFLVR